MRPSLLTIEVHDAIVEAVKAGNTREHAAAAAGISTSTLYSWLRRGKAEENRLGRPYEPTLSEKVAAVVESFVEAGRDPTNEVARLVGEHHRAIEDGDRALVLAEEAKPDEREAPYLKLLYDLRAADGEAATFYMGVIQKAAKAGEWRAAAWYLDRRYPESYGERRQHTHSGDPARPLVHAVAPITEERLREMGADEASSLYQAALEAADTG